MSYFSISILLAVVYSVISMVTKEGQDGKEIIKVRRLPSHREVIHSLVVISGQCCHTKRSVRVFWSFQSVLPYQEVSQGFLVISGQCCHTKKSFRVFELFQSGVTMQRSVRVCGLFQGSVTMQRGH